MIDENIKKQALELSFQERAELAHMLIDSLHPEKEFGSEEAWPKELRSVLTGMNKVRVLQSPGAK